MSDLFLSPMHFLAFLFQHVWVAVKNYFGLAGTIFVEKRLEEENNKYLVAGCFFCAHYDKSRHCGKFCIERQKMEKGSENYLRVIWLLPI